MGGDSGRRLRALGVRRADVILKCWEVRLDGRSAVAVGVAATV